MGATTQQPIVVKAGGNNQLLLAGLALGALGLGYQFILKPELDRRRALNNLKKDQASTLQSVKGKTLYDLNGKPIKSVNLSTIATDIYDSLEAYGPNDGKRVVRVFKNTPFGYVQKLEQFYLDRYGKNLKDHLVKELKDEDWISIKNWFK